MTKDEALDLALEALVYASSYCDTYDAIDAIKQALAAPVQDNSNYRLNPPGLDALYTTPPAQQAPVQPIIGSYLEKDNSQFKFSDYEPDGMHHNKPAVPDAFGTREGEHPQYIQGWNDCRAEMLKGMKP